MGDVFQNVEEVYKKWESKSAPRLKSRFSSYKNQVSDFSGIPKSRSANNVRRNYDEQYYFRKRPQRHSMPKLPKYHDIAQFKMSPTIVPFNKQRPFPGICCKKCLPQSKSALQPYSYIPSLCICNVFLMPFFGGGTPLIPPSIRIMYYMLTRGSKFDYPDVSSKVWQSSRLMVAMNEVMEASTLGIASSPEEEKDECYESFLLKLKDEVKGILSCMKSSVNKYILRISSLLTYNMLRTVMQQILVHKGHIELLKSVSEEDHPMIYIPVHRSNLDHALISLILYMNDLKVPMVALSENHYVPLVSKFLHYLGAFYMQEMSSEKKNVLSQAVLQAYLAECLKMGHSLEILIRQGLSVSGKLQSSQTSLLARVVESVLEEEIEDAYVVPVAISYEKLFEEEEYVSVQLGKCSQSQSVVSSFLSLWKMLHCDFGYTRVDFCQPFSMKEFLQCSNNSITDAVSLHSGETTSKDVEILVKRMADHIVFDVTQATSLMGTQLVAFLFLTRHRQGATLPQLLCSLNWLREELLKRKHDTGFSGESSAVIKHAVTLLGKDLVNTEVIELEWTSSDLENNNIKVHVYKPVVKLPHVLALQYYSRSVIPVFLLDSIVVNALYVMLDDDICHFRLCDSRLFVRRDDLVAKAAELCELLQFEFACFPPCADINLSINDVIDELVSKECLAVVESNNGTAKVKSKSHHHPLSFEFSEDEEEVCTNARAQHLKVDLSDGTIEHLKFLRNILSPYIESYWLSATTLLKLIYEVMEEKEFIKEIQQATEDKLHKGLLGYEESFGTEALENSIKLFESWEVVEHYFEGQFKFLYLSESYDSEEKICSVISRVEQFRQ